MQKVTDAKQLETLRSMERCISRLLDLHKVTYISGPYPVTVLDRTVWVDVSRISNSHGSMLRWRGQGWTVALLLASQSSAGWPPPEFDFEGDWAAFEHDVVLFRLAASN